MVKPMNDNILIKIEKVQEKTKEGFFTSPTANDETERARVISVGFDVENIKKGDTILFKNYSPTKVTIEDDEYNFIKEEEVLAIEK